MKTILLFAFAALALPLHAAPPEKPGSERKTAQQLSRPSVSLYMEANFKGRLTRIKAPADFPGSALLKKEGINNDSLLSLKVPAGVKVSVFDADGYGGENMTFTEGEHATIGKMAGRVSSMKIELLDKK